MLPRLVQLLLSGFNQPSLALIQVKIRCKTVSCTTNYYYYIRLTAFFSRTWVSWHQKGKPFWILRSKRWWGDSGISWTMCRSFAPRYEQITTPVPHHSVFTGRLPFLPLSVQPTASKHWRYLSALWTAEIKIAISIAVKITTQFWPCTGRTASRWCFCQHWPLTRYLHTNTWSQYNTGRFTKNIP